MSEITCEITERSARGYCPGEDPIPEYCSIMPEASFCAGPSDQGGVELAPPQAWERDENGSPVDVSCELDGTCDDSFTDVCVNQGLSFDYETGTCVSVDHESYTPTPETLPETGIEGLFLVVASAMAAMALGVRILTGGA